MLLLDENITDDQKALLEKWRFRVQKVGKDVLFKEILDDPIVNHLHKRRKTDFATRDDDFFDSRYCHRNYSIFALDVAQLETAFYLRKLLRHPRFNTKAKRLGKVLKVSQTLITFFTHITGEIQRVKW